MKKNGIIVLRSLWRQKEFSFMNVLGLGVGIGSALLIFLLIRNELSIDDFHHQKERIYRVVSTETYRNGILEYDGCAPLPLGDALRSEFPQVEQEATTFLIYGNLFTIPAIGSAAEKKFKSDLLYAEPSFFKIMDFAWLRGDAASALSAPNSIVLTKSQAEAWFGRWEDAVGKTVLWRGDHKPLLVTGILQDSPVNTDFPIKVVVSFSTFRQMDPTAFTNPGQWDNFEAGVQSFFLLKQGSTIASMNAMLPGFVARHYTPLFANSDTRDSSFFQPLKEMHFDERLSHYGNGSLSYTELWSMGSIGIFLLLVACINFINLATALSLKRAKEVGVRKVLGGTRGQLFLRFIGETACLVGIAVLVGCILAEIALGPLRHLVEKEIPQDAIFSPSTLLFLLATAVVVTFLAGSYPGLVLSGFNPVGALKSKLSGRPGGSLSLRRGLVVVQFVIAQLLIIGTLVIVRQMNYFMTRPMGFDRKAVAMVTLGGGPRNQYFKSRVLDVPGVISASLCSQAPSTDGWWSSGITLEGHSHPEDFEVVRRFGDADYLQTFHIPLVTGRMPRTSDSAAEAVLNMMAVRRLGFHSADDIIGRKIRGGGWRDKYIPVVGVVKDFNMGPLREQMRPMLLLSDTGTYWNLAVRIDPLRTKQVLQSIRAISEQVFPEGIFEYSFLDDQVTSFYHAEAITSYLFEIFAGLAIFISCLGLYGLVSFMVTQKTKEVGIRKVLGATVEHIVFLFSREFIMLVMAALLIAGPLGYYLMTRWLSGFYYRTDVHWTIFALTIFLSVSIAWATVGYRALRAALANPARSLRTE